MSKHFDLSGRVAVITGGARGIGLAAAQRMADAGADIAVVDRDADATAAAVRDIEARGRRALGCPIELTDERLEKVLAPAQVGADREHQGIRASGSHTGITPRADRLISP